MPKPLLLVLVLLCTACTPTAGPEEGEAVPHRVDLLFGISGLGDGGYNDGILRGILEAAQKYGFDLSFHCPVTLEAGWAQYEKWLAELPDFPGRSLFIFASNDYVQLLQASNPGPLDKGSRLLIDTTEDIPYVADFCLDMYGGSYWIGWLAAATASQAAALAANFDNPILLRACDGFDAGCQDAGMEEANIYALRTGATEGYHLQDEAYELAYDLGRWNQFIYPLAGESNLGIYRYTREHPQGPYTAGMDTDMNSYSTQVVASLVKRTDLVLDKYIQAWLNREALPPHIVYGLDSDFIEVKISPRHASRFASVPEDIKQRAIEKEHSHAQ